MADIELRKSFLGNALVGQIEIEPTLSWGDRSALADSSRASRELADQTAAMRRRLESVDLNVVAVGRAVVSLERELGYRLESAARILVRQIEVLEDIAAALRTPAKTRAAERLVDVAELLKRQRWSRALAIAQAATDDDPNNPAGFLAAGWARMGLGELESARADFVEAADAGDGLRRSAAGRQAARLTFAVDDAAAALKLLDFYATTACPPLPDGLAWDGSHTIDLVARWSERRFELAAVQYDRAVYLAALGDLAESARELEDAGEASPTFFAMASTDTQLVEHGALVELAAARLDEAMAAQQVTIGELLRRARDLFGGLAEFEDARQELPKLRELVERLDMALVEVCPQDPSRLLIDGLLLDDLEGVRDSLEVEELGELQQSVEEAALLLASKMPGTMARPSPDRTIEVEGLQIETWEVEQPRSGFMRTSHIWWVSTDGVEPTITRLC